MKDGTKVEHRITPRTGPRDGVVLRTTTRGQVAVLWWDGEESDEDRDDLIILDTYGMGAQASSPPERSL